VNCLPVSLLYIESDPEYRETILPVLRESVEELYVTDDRREGMELFRSTTPDIVVIDMKNARLNNFSFLKELFKQRPDLPVFTLICRNEMPYLTQAVELGVRYYLHKRKDPLKLIDSLRDFFQFDFSDQLYALLDNKGRFHEVSEAFANYVGHTVSQMNGHSLDTFVRFPKSFNLHSYLETAKEQEKDLPILTFIRPNKSPRQLGSIVDKMQHENLYIKWYPFAEITPSYSEFHEKLRREAHLKSLLGFMAEIGRAGIEAHSKNQFLQKILQLIPQVSHGTEGFLLSRETDDQYRFVDGTEAVQSIHFPKEGISADDPEAEIEFLPIALAARHRQIVFLDDIGSLHKGPFKAKLEEMGMTTVIAVPISGVEKIRDHILVLLFRSRHPFDKEELELWRSIADTITFTLASIHYRKERDRLIAKLNVMAHTDQLTGLLNRYRGLEIIKSEIARAKRYGQPLSLLFFDIDKFKDINDTFGHETGDRVLHKTSASVKSILRSVDYLIRWGGEEFIAVLPETELPGAVKLAHKLRETIPQKSIDLPVKVTASFGVVEWNAEEDIDTLISRADKKMYEAKQQGRNRISY